MIVPSRILPDPWCFVAFDDYGGRLSRMKDHIGEEGCGPGSKTLCGRPLQRYGYPIRESEPDANFFCKTCVAAAHRRGWEILALLKRNRRSLILTMESRGLWVPVGVNAHRVTNNDLRRMILDHAEGKPQQGMRQAEPPLPIQGGGDDVLLQ